MLQFKNLEGHIIILYDTDELIATECATTMAQRGFENVFVVSTMMNNIILFLSFLSRSLFSAFGRVTRARPKVAQRTCDGQSSRGSVYVARWKDEIEKREN